jgi:hypothetical protein
LGYDTPDLVDQSAFCYPIKGKFRVDPHYQGNYPPTPPRRAYDPWTLAIIAAAALAGLTCVVALGLLCIFVLLPPPAPPATPKPVLNATNLFATTNPVPLTPTLDPASVGKVINPYVSANLGGMSVLQIDVLDSTSGNYVRAAQLTGSDLDIFSESFNISVQTVAPNTGCPDHVRLSITRSDSTIVTMGVCLKGVVILRGIPDLGGADAPMGPRFSDALAPYLPDNYRKLLNF